jgi:hypothetical protein
MKSISYAAVLLLAAAAAACSSTTEKTPDPTPGPAATGTATTAPTTDPPAGTMTPPAPVALKAPTIDKVMKMQGALHVEWTNVDTSCDSVEGEREANMPDGTLMEKYKVVFTVPGEADNKHDTSATDNMKYTYKLRCKKGTTYSPYSNEMSGNPQ